MSNNAKASYMIGSTSNFSNILSSVEGQPERTVSGATSVIEIN
jgi:hypothetical protein